MATKEVYLADFQENEIYHVFNRTNNNEPLFLKEENRRFFLRQYDYYLSPFLETYCYCLLSNHFHFLVRIKSKEQICTYLSEVNKEALKAKENDYLQNPVSCELLIELEWHRFFTSYSMAFNRMFNRKGNLFNRPFKRVLINKEAHLKQSIVYIHANPVKHYLCKDYQNYKWSSFSALLSLKPTKLLRQEVLDWFGNKEQFIKAHEDLTKHYYIHEGMSS